VDVCLLAVLGGEALARQVTPVDAGPDVRSALTARVRREGARYEVAYADLTFTAGSQSGLVAAAYRRWQGRAPYAGSV
jgi:hypothetical protein